MPSEMHTHCAMAHKMMPMWRSTYTVPRDITHLSAPQCSRPHVAPTIPIPHQQEFVKSRFQPERFQNFFSSGEKRKEAVTSLLSHERGRQLIYELSAEHRNSLMLTFAIQKIMKQVSRGAENPGKYFISEAVLTCFAASESACCSQVWVKHSAMWGF